MQHRQQIRLQLKPWRLVDSGGELRVELQGR